jgi:peptidoglycan/xylan/chitin deacetylase (PgdA/CDA1 family)
MPVIEAIETDRKLVALTFDDGPTHPYTELVLDVLASEAARATFFVLGAAVVPETSAFVLRAAAEGHELGNTRIATSPSSTSSTRTRSARRSSGRIASSRH